MAKLTILATLMVFAAIFSQAFTQPIVQYGGYGGYQGYDGYNGYQGYDPNASYNMNEWQQRAGHGSIDELFRNENEHTNSKSTLPGLPFFGDLSMITTADKTKQVQSTHSVRYFK